MPERTFQVEAENVIPEGFPELDGPAVDYPESAIQDLMLRAAVVLEMVGGVFSVVAIRRQIAHKMFVPDFYRAKWESYAPSLRAQPQQDAEPEREPEPEPEPTELTPEEREDHFPEEPEPDDLGPDPEREPGDSVLDGIVGEHEPVGA